MQTIEDARRKLGDLANNLQGSKLGNVTIELINEVNHRTAQVNEALRVIAETQNTLAMLDGIVEGLAASRGKKPDDLAGETPAADPGSPAAVQARVEAVADEIGKPAATDAPPKPSEPTPLNGKRRA